MNDAPPARDRFRHLRRKREIALVSTITLFELWFGIVKSRRQAENADQLSAFLTAVQIAEFDDSDARAAADIRLNPARAGTPIGSYDLLIAAQAIRRDLTVITANAREFSRVPDLRWENWEA